MSALSLAPGELPVTRPTPAAAVMVAPAVPVSSAPPIDLPSDAGFGPRAAVPATAAVDDAVSRLTRRRQARAAAAPGTRTDPELVAAARAGSLDAFNELVTRHERVVYGAALRVLRNPAAAEDATQDAMIRAWQGIASFEGASVLAWLIRIAVNRCYDVIRADRRRPAGSLDAAMQAERDSWAGLGARPDAPGDWAERDELSARLAAALAGLSAAHREVVVRADVRGESHEEIAAALGIAPGTVRSRLCRARACLRGVLLPGGEPVTAADADGEPG